MTKMDRSKAKTPKITDRLADLRQIDTWKPIDHDTEKTESERRFDTLERAYPRPRKN